MKTLKKGFSRGLSILLTLMMVLSLTVVGMVSTSAADVTLVETGFNISDIYLISNRTTWDRNETYSFKDDASVTVTGMTQPFQFRLSATNGNHYGPSSSIKIKPSTTDFDTFDAGFTNSGTTWEITPSEYNCDSIDIEVKLVLTSGVPTSVQVKVTTNGSSGGGTETPDPTPGDMRTFATGEKLYIKNFHISGWTDAWIPSTGYATAILTNSETGATTTCTFSLLEGEAGTDGAIYEASIPVGGEYDQIIITRNQSSDDKEWNRTGTMTLAADETINCFTGFTKDGTSYTGSVYTPATPCEFWVDLSPEEDESTADLIYPVKDGTTYTLYLPSGVDRTAVPIKHTGTNLQFAGVSVTSGNTVNLSASAVSINGDINGQLNVYKSSNVSSIHTTTSTDVPQGTSQGYPHKDDYSDKGTIIVFDKNGNQVNAETTLKKIKGRGNSSWEASDQVVGKYAFNLTLQEKAQLLDESNAAKKYCLVSYNADQARMRNMVTYELAQQIGLKFNPDYQPVDFYNNGQYIGSYLLTDKVEIGNPLVDILNLDKANENYAANATVFETEEFIQAASNGNVDDTSTKGFYKYISNIADDPVVDYSQSGFLLEFELNERFANELSGFISNKGQQIVSKYPEYATENQIKFIMGKWNEAEAIMYDADATYEELSAVIDVESFARMYLIQELTKNLDSGATSYYVYYDGGKFHAGPVWDYDWALGQYANDYSDKLSSASTEHSPTNGDLDNHEGWYVNSKSIYGNKGTFNVQAALTQNPAFWNAVKAEWNENFYHQVDLIVPGTVSEVSDLTGEIKNFYNEVKDSTAMDEHKWNIIANNPMSDWGSADTGNTHAEATVSLNNWIRNRLVWMDGYLGIYKSQDKADFYKADYTIQPPVVTTDKAEYDAGENVILTITDITGGEYTHTIYRDGVQIATGVAENTYTDKATGTTSSKYTVISKSAGISGKQSAASDPAEITITDFNLAITGINAPETAMVGDTLYIKVNTNVTASTGFAYTLTFGDNQKRENATGIFNNVTVTPDMISGAYEFTVTVTGVVDGKTQTATETFTVNITDYEMTLNVKAPASAEIGSVVTINATANAAGEVNYELFEVNGTETSLGTNTNGIFTVDIPEAALNTTKNYKVVATTTVEDQLYTKESTVAITVTAVSEAYTVVLYFKSADSYGYVPQLTTTGAVNDADIALMTRYQFICKNVTQTASYSWYKSDDLTVSKSSGQLMVNVVGTRYNMEGDITLTLSDYVPNEAGVIEVYLACNNLNYNSDVKIHDLTGWTEEERNWTMNAANMVLNKETTSKEDIAAVSAMINPRYIGDTNNDGVVNIKDATLIQKSLAEIATLDALTKNIADVWYDGTLTVKDATAIQKRVVNL